MSPTLSVDTVLLQHLLNFWDDRGINIAPVWRELGISAGAPLPPRIASIRLGQLLHELSVAGHDPMLPARSGLYLAAMALPITRLLGCAPSLNVALPQALDLLCRQAGGTDIRVVNDEQRIMLTLVPAAGMHNALAAMMLAWLATVIRQVAADAALQLRVPDHAPEWQLLLQMPAESGDWCLSMPVADWLAVLPGSDAALSAQISRELERSQRKFEEVAGLYQELQQIMQAALERRMITQESVADQVGLSVRNLQRRLKTLGTTYQNLLDESRQALAMRLVEHSDMPLYEIAFMVGYAEPSAFYKAFRRWTGSTPGDYRQALTETADE